MEKKRILAVDDNSVNLSVIELVLQNDYEVIPMLSGKRVVKFLGRQAADLVLLDVQMPEMNGVETLKELRGLENGKDIPVIFLTGTEDAEAAAEGERLGIVDYITKPFDNEDLKTRIARVLSQTLF